VLGSRRLSVYLRALYEQRPDLRDLAGAGEEAMIRRVLELEAAAKIRVPIGDSRMTHAPPSSDPRPKPRSRRLRSGKRSGGQPGHKGHRLEPVAKPDRVIDYAVTSCSCGTDLRHQPVAAVVAHQVFDLPQIRLEVTEHRCERKSCPTCERVSTARAPAGARQPTQYGPRLACWAVYLTVGHFVPVARSCELIHALTGTRPSQGWVLSCQRRLSRRLDGFTERVTELLRQSSVVCCDETGFRFGGKRRWLHVCCTAVLTLLLVSRFRGREGTMALGILGTARVAIHDNYPSYFTFEGAHGLCNAHHQRELIYVKMELGGRWAGRMIRVLLDGKRLKEHYHSAGKLVPANLIARIRRRYRLALQAGYAIAPTPSPRRPGQRGKIARGKERCLLDRLRDREEETLLFLMDIDVPWENNQAERDLRMAKVQQKVSGGFRTESGAQIFARCRSYIDTMRKQNHDPMTGIMTAMSGDTWMPQTPKTTKKQTKAA
jgi:transposase